MLTLPLPLYLFSSTLQFEMCLHLAHHSRLCAPLCRAWRAVCWRSDTNQSDAVSTRRRNRLTNRKPRGGTPLVPSHIHAENQWCSRATETQPGSGSGAWTRWTGQTDTETDARRLLIEDTLKNPRWHGRVGLTCELQTRSRSPNRFLRSREHVDGRSSRTARGRGVRKGGKAAEDGGEGDGGGGERGGGRGAGGGGGFGLRFAAR